MVAENRTAIQINNAVLPILALFAVGGAQVFFRKKKWTKQ
jgi:hypothetical protein